jgi:C4-dicarboxylate-specific signal transduction histidine kinase
MSFAGEMVSGIAHELNQPLTAIINYAYSCQEELELNNVDVQFQLHLAKKIIAQAQRAGEIIRRLRGLVKRSEPKRSSLDVRETIEHALTFIQNDILLNEIQLRIVVPDRLPVLIGDSILMEQLLLNLIRNAIESQVDQADAAREILIEVAADAAGVVTITVADNGNATRIHDIEEMFSPFFTTKPNGMGIGLTISRTIAEAHHGTLSAHRRPIRGIEFRLILPIESAAQ